MKVLWIIYDYFTISKGRELLIDAILLLFVFVFSFFSLSSTNDAIQNTIGNISGLSGVVIGVSLALFGFLLASDSEIVKMAKKTILKKRRINDGELTVYGLLLIYISYSLIIQFVLVLVDVILYTGFELFIKVRLGKALTSLVNSLFVYALWVVLRGVIYFYSMFFYPDKEKMEQ